MTQRKLNALERLLAPAGLIRLGEAVAFVGVLLPLLLIGAAKFTTAEIQALAPLLGGVPWLAWLPAVVGERAASHLLGVTELATVGLLALSLRWPVAGIVGGALAVLTFLTTCSIMLAVPIWDPTSGPPFPGPVGQFLLKDVALLGVAFVILGRNLARRERAAMAPARGHARNS